MICASSFSSKHHVHSFSISPTTFRLSYTCHHFYSTASSRCLCRWMGLPAIQKNYVVWQCGIFQWKNGTSNVVCTCFNWLKVRLVWEASSCTHSDSQQVYIFGRGTLHPSALSLSIGASKTHVLIFRSLRTPQSSNFLVRIRHETSIKSVQLSKIALEVHTLQHPWCILTMPKKGNMSRGGRF